MCNLVRMRASSRFWHHKNDFPVDGKWMGLNSPLNLCITNLLLVFGGLGYIVFYCTVEILHPLSCAILKCLPHTQTRRWRSARRWNQTWQTDETKCGALLRLIDWLALSCRASSRFYQFARKLQIFQPRFEEVMSGRYTHINRRDAANALTILKNAAHHGHDNDDDRIVQ